MIIKSMPRKTISFGQLLEYLNAPEQKGASLLQNFRTKSQDTELLQKEFLDNARYLPPRKNGNVLYHEIISASDIDRERVTSDILIAIARKYLELRAPYALVYGRVHLDTDCPHIHLIISANSIESDRRISLTRDEFTQIKRDVEAYQREHFPELKKSLVMDPEGVNNGRKERPHRESRAESERIRRLKREEKYGDPAHMSKKERLAKSISDHLRASSSAEAFVARLRNYLGMKLYRRGKHVGVEKITSKRRHRLATLGVAEAFEQAQEQWKRLPERLQALGEVEREQFVHLWEEAHVRESIQDVFEHPERSHGDFNSSKIRAPLRGR